MSFVVAATVRCGADCWAAVNGYPGTPATHELDHSWCTGAQQTVDCSTLRSVRCCKDGEIIDTQQFILLFVCGICLVLADSGLVETDLAVA